MSFGYGAGDFIAVATIAWKISVALRSTKGASESYNALIKEMESTAQSLYQTGNLLENAGLPASTANCISHGLSLCHSNLLKLKMIVKEYQRGFETPTTAQAKQKDWHSLWGLKAQLKKVQWEMCEKECVNEIRQNIKSGVAEIVLVLEACGLNAIRRMESQIRETCAVVKRVEATLPQGMCYWPWDHKVIYLDDALGRSIPIPFELCIQWEVFKETLKLAFRDRPGSSRINAGQFTIKTQRHKLLLPAEWGHSVKPSMTLLMSVVLNLQCTWFISECPLCGTIKQCEYLSDPDDDLEQTQCKGCCAWFSVSSESEITVLGMAGDNNSNSDRDSVLQAQGERVDLAEEEVKHFKRLDVVLSKHLTQDLQGQRQLKRRIKELQIELAHSKDLCDQISKDQKPHALCGLDKAYDGK